MNGLIDKNKIDYVLFHLNQSIEINDKLKEKFVFIKHGSDLEIYRNKIIFLLSEDELVLDKVKWINEIPILFPNSNDINYFNISNNNLIFTDDLLKSAFYFLSGFQEFKSKNKDAYGRFTFTKSIHSALKITGKPVVNYYFEQIAQGIEQFCLNEAIYFRRKNLFENFGFILTHDVDRVDAYNYYNVGSIFKQLIGLSKPQYRKSITYKVFIRSFYYFINIFSNKNPFWTFEYLRSLEINNNFRSVFYFLKNESKLDARYSWHEKRILKLMKYFISEKCEIGLHGTMKSALNIQSMEKPLSELMEISGQDIVGCRHHFLQFHHPETIRIQEKCGIKYDSTLCFAEHEGFRNGYCLPFKLFDFDENRMIDVWEFPLNVMDGTLLGYRNLSYEEADESIRQLISEIKKFKGLFVLLWHNCFFDEDRYPGVTEFYEHLLNLIKQENPENLLGKELVERLLD